MITDGEISRAVNALSTTLRDQRPEDFDASRMQSIVDGALAGERKLVVRHLGGAQGDVVTTEGRRIASVDRSEGRWIVVREVDATGSGWAVPSQGSA